MNALDQKIEEAWQLRVELESEKALNAAIALQAELGLPSSSLMSNELDVLLSHEDAQSRLSVLVLLSSLSYLNGRTKIAIESLDNINRSCERLGFNNFYLEYEKARRLFQMGDYYLSLETFVRARNLAKSNLQEVWASANSVLCLENLGQPFDSLLNEVRAKIMQLKVTQRSRIDSQLKAFELRNLFRHGNLKSFFSTVSEVKEDLFGQSNYFIDWVRNLPFHSYFQKDLSTTNYLLSKNKQHNAAYRARTLEGVQHPADRLIEKPSEWADRLYLWTWRLLTENGEADFYRLHSMLFEQPNWKEIHLFTFEDRLLIRNALSWLSLFDRDLVVPAYFCFESKNEAFPLFDLEYLVIHYFKAIVDNSEVKKLDYKRLIERHPLYHSNDLLFKSLVQRDNVLPILTELITKVCSKPQSNHNLHVDLPFNTVHDLQNDELVESNSICKALLLVSKKNKITSKEFVKEIFNFSKYEPFDHKPRIYNLAARIKKVTRGKIIIKLFQNFILTDGRWEDIFIEDLVFPERFVLNYVGKGNFENIKKKNVTTKCPHWNGKISRKELEVLLNYPRSTVNRMLVSWESAGVIERQGKSKNTVYKRIDKSFLQGEQ